MPRTKSVKNRASRLFIWLVVSSFLLPVSSIRPVLAQYSSPNYRVEEAFFGTGGELDANSANYKARQSAGDLAAGTTSSTNYDAFAGFVTPEEPFLALVVNAATIDLGLLNESTTATGNGTFSVRTYLSSAYSVKTMSQPPTNESGSVLNGMSAQASSAPGTEQFGINLVANTSPAAFGANAANVPDNTFADGEVAPGYDTANLFKYVVGDTIARSPKTAGNPAVGQTDYTLSYIANIASITAAGQYTMGHDIVVVATY
jgi:hypothetical protein